jgi:hypothetical protein
MTQHRPDLLPFARSDTIGLPYHGLVKNGAFITAATGVSHPQPSTGPGDTNLVRHTKSSSPNRTGARAALDAQKHYHVQDYALLSGTWRQIGGQDLGSDLYHWIYCDDNYSWQVSAALTYSASSASISIWLEKPFGIFGTTLAMTRRQLATYSFNFKYYSGSANTRGSVSYLHMTHSQTGAISAVNCVMTNNAYNRYLQTAQIAHSFKIAISGNGSIETGHVGDGISAICSKLADAPDMVTTSTVTTGDTTHNWANLEGLPYTTTTLDHGFDFVPNPDDVTSSTTITCTEWNIDTAFPEDAHTSGQYTTTYTVSRAFLYCAIPTGQIINVDEQYESVTVNQGSASGSLVGAEVYYANVSEYSCDPVYNTCYGIDAYLTGATSFNVRRDGSLSSTISYTISFGDYRKELSHSSSSTKYVDAIWEFSVVSVAGSGIGCSYQCLGEFASNAYINSGSTAGTTPEWDFSASYTLVGIKTNNVIVFTGERSNELISILGNTAVSADPYVSFDPGTGQIATASDAAITWV